MKPQKLEAKCQNLNLNSLTFSNSHFKGHKVNHVLWMLRFRLWLLPASSQQKVAGARAQVGYSRNVQLEIDSSNNFRCFRLFGKMHANNCCHLRRQRFHFSSLFSTERRATLCLLRSGENKSPFFENTEMHRTTMRNNK